VGLVIRMAEQSLPRRWLGVDRRSRVYLGASVVAVVVTGLVAGAIAYAVLAAAAAGAWITRQHPVVRWTLTALAGILIAALLLGLATGSARSGSRVGPPTPAHP
jgi:hypothetical protein